MTPLDVVKIRLQAQRTPFSKGNRAWGWGGSLDPIPGSPCGCAGWQSQWLGFLSSRAHVSLGPLSSQALGAPLGELGWCLALSFPLTAPLQC